MDELKLLIGTQKKKPHIIAITEAKPKNYSGELLASEFELDRYNVFYDWGKDDSLEAYWCMLQQKYQLLIWKKAFLLRNTC